MNAPQTLTRFIPARTASRRQFLSRSAAAIAVVLTWPSGLLAADRKFVMKELSLDELRLATFAGQVQTTFRVTDAPVAPVELTLIEASPAKTSAHARADALDAHYEKFSLTFSGPRAPLLAQQMYRFEHAQIGWFVMFIVPIVTEPAGEQHYQAVFNRPIFAGSRLTT